MSDAEDAAHQEDLGNWCTQHLQQLIDRVEHYASIRSRGSGLLRSRCTCISHKLDWDLVKFDHFSADACKQQWERVLFKVGKIRTTKELLDNAAVWLRKPVQKRGHSELPKKPLTAFVQFSTKLSEELRSKHPAAGAADIAQMVKASYKELSESSKAELREQYQQKLAAYDAQLEDFYAAHPDMRPMRKPRRPKTLYVEEQIKAELERLAIVAGQGPQKQQRRVGKDVHHELRKKYSDQWQNLPDLKKTQWILNAMKQYNEYLAANPRTAKSMPRLLNANEQKLLAAHRLRPTRPPDNIVRYYMSVCPDDVARAVDFEAAETAREDGRRKSRVRLYATRWRALTLPEQIKYWRAYYEAVIAYRTAMREWLSKQSTAVHESTVADEKNYEEKTARSFADVEEYGKQCGYTIMGPAGLVIFERHRRKYLTVTHPDEAAGPEGLRRVAHEVYTQLSDDKRKPYEEKESKHLSGFASTSLVMQLKRKSADGGDEATTTKRAKAANEIDGILLPPEPKKPHKSSYHSFIAHFAAADPMSNDSSRSLNPAERQKRFGDSVRRWKQLSKDERKQWEERYAAENKQYQARLEAYKKSLTTEQLEAYKRRCREQAGVHCLRLDETRTVKKSAPRPSVLLRSTLQRSALQQHNRQSVVYHPPAASDKSSRSSVATPIQSFGQLSRDAIRKTGQTEAGCDSVYDFNEPHDGSTTAEAIVDSNTCDDSADGVALSAAAVSNAAESRARTMTDSGVVPVGVRRTLFTLRSPSSWQLSPSGSQQSTSGSQPSPSRPQSQQLRKSVPPLPLQQHAAPADDAGVTKVARQPVAIVDAVSAASHSQGESRLEFAFQRSTALARSPRGYDVAKAGNPAERNKEADGGEKVHVKIDEESCGFEDKCDPQDLKEGTIFVVNVVEEEVPHNAEIEEIADEVDGIDVNVDGDGSGAGVEDDEDEDQSMKEDKEAKLQGSEDDDDEEDDDEEDDDDEEEDLEESCEDEDEDDCEDVDEGAVVKDVDKDDPHNAAIEEKDDEVHDVDVSEDDYRSDASVEDDDDGDQSMEEDEEANVEGNEDDDEEDVDDDEEDAEEEEDEEEEDLEESCEDEEEDDQDVDEGTVSIVNGIEKDDPRHAEIEDDEDEESEEEVSDIAEDTEAEGSFDLLERSFRWSQLGQLAGQVRTDAASHRSAIKELNSCSQMIDGKQNVSSDSRRTADSRRSPASGHSGRARARNASGGSTASSSWSAVDGSISLNSANGHNSSCSSRNVGCGRVVASDRNATSASQKAISQKPSGVQRSSQTCASTRQNAHIIGSSSTDGGRRNVSASQNASNTVANGTGSQNSSSGRNTASSRRVGGGSQTAVASQQAVGNHGRQHPSSSQNSSTGRHVGGSRNFVKGGSAGASQKASNPSLIASQQSSVDKDSNVTRSCSSRLNAGHDRNAGGSQTERSSQVLGSASRQRTIGAGSQNSSSSQGTGVSATASDGQSRAITGSRQQQLRAWLQPSATSGQSDSPRQKSIVDFLSVAAKPSIKAEQGKAA